MNNKNSVNLEITFYIRTAKKLGFLAKSKKSVLTLKQIKQIAQNKTKIPTNNQILYYNGQRVLQNTSVRLVNKSIVHLLDSRNIGKSKMKLLIKRLPQNNHIDSFQVDSDVSIDSFIQNQLSAFYQQPAEKLFFVYTGRQLNKQNSFTQQHVQSESELFCLHQQKDQKKKTKSQSPINSEKSLKTKDTAQNEQIMNSKKQQTFNYQNQQHYIELQKNIIFNKPQVNVKAQRSQSLKQFKSGNLFGQQEHISLEIFKHQEYDYKLKTIDQQVHLKIQDNKQSKLQEKKLIASIDQIKCVQYYSDQDSGNQGNQKQGYSNNISKKLPQEFLNQQTHQRSITIDNKSQTSFISQPNFKKKKKVSEIQVTLQTNSHRKSDEQSSKSPIQKLENDQINQNKEENAQKNLVHAHSSRNVLKTRQQIFQFNTNTFSSVIDQFSQASPHNHQQPQQRQYPKSQQTVLTVQKSKSMFNSYTGQYQNQVYDSQMNQKYYEQVKQQKDQIKYNKGFMNFSNVNFLQAEREEKLYAPSYELIENRNQEHRRYQYEVKYYQNNNCHKFEEEKSAIQINELQSMQNRTPQTLEANFMLNNNVNKDEIQTNRTQSIWIQNGNSNFREGDSLSFSKNSSQLKSHNHPQQSQDNLFVEYKRGYQAQVPYLQNRTTSNQYNGQTILIQQQSISQSNLLYDTYNQPNMTFNEQYNSISFNLQQNLDQKSPSKIRQQSSIDINVDQQMQRSQQILLHQGQQQNNNQFIDEKRQSQLETNFSPDPSQITSNPSSQINLNYNNNRFNNNYNNNIATYNSGFKSSDNGFFGIIQNNNNLNQKENDCYVQNYLDVQNNKNIQNNEHFVASAIQPLSLIQNLLEMVDIRIKVNQIKSQNINDQENLERRNSVQSHSDISYHSTGNNENQIFQQNRQMQQVSSNAYVSYRTYGINNEEYGEYFINQRQLNYIQSDLLQYNSYDDNLRQKSLGQQNYYYKKNIHDANQESQIDKLNQLQTNDIKIQQQSNVIWFGKSQQYQHYQSSRAYIQQLNHQYQQQQDQSIQKSAAFHQISQSQNYQNNQITQLAFRKDHHHDVLILDSFNNQIKNQENYQNIGLRKNQFNKGIQIFQYVRNKTLLEQLDGKAINKQENQIKDNVMDKLENQIKEEEIIEEQGLLPGDYIYSSDQVQNPDQVLGNILESFTHCF